MTKIPKIAMIYSGIVISQTNLLSMNITTNTENSIEVKKIILAKPRGFCAGVNRAIDIVDLALQKYGSPLYVRHEIVHNHHVVNDFKDRGVIFVEDLDEVPDDSYVIFSAHGTDPQVIEKAKQRKLRFIDAVCPLVTKVHTQIEKAVSENKTVLYIGHKGHQEVVGAMGHAPHDIRLVENVDDVDSLPDSLSDQEIFVCTQTTLSVDDTASIVQKLKEKFPKIEFPNADDICYATQNRQDAVKELVKICDHILIIGSKNSSNTLRLLELAQKSGIDAELVPDPNDYIVSKKLENKTIGISSGASAPESLVEKLVRKLLGNMGINKNGAGSDGSLGASRGEIPNKVETLVFKEEKIVFPMPELI